MEGSKTRRHIPPENKARLVVDFLRSKKSAAALCQKYRISESNYYRWKKTFVTAGMEALRRRPQRRKHRSSGICTRHKQTAASVEAAKEDLRRSVKAMLGSSAERKPKLPDAARPVLVRLIETTSISKASAIAIAGIPRSTYYRWRKTASLNNAAHERDATLKRVKLTDLNSVKETVFKVLHSPPSDHGFNRTTWKIADLQQALRNQDLAIGKHAIRTIIKDAGYRWRKAKKVLTSRDPLYRTKLDHIQSILGGLAKNEGFFSIDEYGPFAVKLRGGRRLVAPGEIATVPQWQRSKGALIITAALELSTNQISHFYSEKKNTEEMIKLLDMLLERNCHLSRIYLSWDAASWHISKRLSKRVASNNVMAYITGSTHVELAPLPAGAQFLNVIESVFSGMARAIIHNSNYQSKDDAKAAIDRYFADRNQYFRMNPKRAGHRIWGKELKPASFSESNNCKDPSYR
jgi:transposase